jgi:predicted transcriptional regulator
MDNQRDLFAQGDFGGTTYDPALDHDRLKRQLGRVWDCMKDGCWRTLSEIEAVTGDPQASVSARLRDLRKEQFGAYLVSRRRKDGRGTWEYRVLREVLC